MSRMINKIEGKITSGKIEKGMEMLKNSSAEELTKHLEKIDRGELKKKINELDINKIKEMNIDVNEIKKRLSQSDIEKIKKVAGKDSEFIMKKLDELS